MSQNLSKSARHTALDVLMRISRDGAYSNIALSSALSSGSLSPKDRNFASALVYGVLERRLLLDYDLAQYSDRNINELDDTVREILRLGMWQILFADGVPASAAVNESVRLCREAGKEKACGFVNAVLRSAAKVGEPVYPDKKRGKNKYLSVRYSCPESVIKLWRKSYGDDICENILSSLTGRPPIYIRINTLKTDAAGLSEKLRAESISVKPCPFSQEALEIADTGDIESSELYRKGLFHVQDEASQVCCGALCAQEGMTVIDACSAPGGKTFTIGEMMNGRGRIIACDLYEHRLRLVEEGARRLGIGIITAYAADSSKNTELPEADRILCDVPCSGLGIMRRKPELRYKSDTGAEALPAVQYDILCSSAAHLKSGGVLVYSTCTLNPAENGDNIRRFLEDHEDFEPFPLVLPEGIARTVEEPENEITLFPSPDGSDGFFISAVRRK